MSLEDAVKYAEMLFKSAGRTPVDPEVAVKAMGYTGLNGASRTTMAALAGYGLLSKTGGKYRVSDEGLRILRPVGDQDRLKALRQLALRPALFERIHREHRECNEPILASTLLHEGFREDSAKKAAKIYKDNIEFATLDESGYPEDMNRNESSESGGQAPPRKPPIEHVRDMMGIQGTGYTPFANPTAQELPLLVEGDRIARIPYPMSAKSFTRFLKMLELYRDEIVREPEVAAARSDFPKSAIWRNKDHDAPVTLVGFMGERDGVRFYQTDGGTGIPETELEMQP